MWVNGREAFALGMLPAHGRIEVVAERGAHLTVPVFCVSGMAGQHSEMWLPTEAMSGAACRPGEWVETSSAPASPAPFVSAMPDARAKFNFEGRRCELYAPRGPSFGRARVLLDGGPPADVDFRADVPTSSDVVHTAEPGPGRHALVIETISGVTPLAGLRVFA
jgi:hypothetical protein